VVRSVANLTRRDGQEFFKLAAELPLATEVTPFPLTQADQALEHLRHGELRGAAVLIP
jgi:propanol-preferring alcohol dehydrogenase